MKIWAISDLHLSFSVPNKTMDLFGPEWKDHPKKIAAAWDKTVSSNDLVLIPGDISWALRLEDALLDLEWIEKRPGTKVIIRGNHDYWWSSLSKVKKVLPPSIHLIQNSSVTIGEVSIAGARLWDSPEYSFDDIIDFKTQVAPHSSLEAERGKEDTSVAMKARLSHLAKEQREVDYFPQPACKRNGEQLGFEPCITEKKREEKDDAAIFQRELSRLEMSLRTIPKEAKVRIAMTHFPPIGVDLAPSVASALFEKYGVSIVAFGHLHSLHKELHPLFGSARGVRYELTSCDFIQFVPKLLL